LKASDDAWVRSVAESLEHSTVEAIEGVRRLALELRPPTLDDLGLWAALGDLAQRYDEQNDITVDYEWRGARERLPADLELILYRIAQEALTNVVKHSQATRASIEVDRRPREISVTVTDDGIGIDPSVEPVRDERGLGLGIFGMVERTTLVGGCLRVTHVEPRGTSVVAVVPLALAERILHPAGAASSGAATEGSDHRHD
jgi:signal transduction histidine kinase